MFRNTRQNLFFFLIIFSGVILWGKCDGSAFSDSEARKLKEKLVSLYPGESPVVTLTRISEVKKAHHFFRSFVPYYYDLFRSNPGYWSSISDAVSYQALCVGDAHPENFGSILQNDLKAIFTVNDPDDASECPIVFDILRFLVATRFHRSPSDLGDVNQMLYAAYRSGLKNEPRPVSKALDAWLKKFEKKGTELPKKYEAAAKLGYFPPVNESFTTLLVSEKEKLISAFKVKLPNQAKDLSVLDVASFSKNTGGSGGLTRYLFLLKDKKNRASVIEWKEMRVPGASAFLQPRSASLPSGEALKAVLKWEQGVNLNEFFSSVEFDSQVFFSRPKWAGLEAVSIKSFEKSEQEEIFLVEAWLLGTLHRSSLGEKVSKYIETLDKISEKQLTEISEKVFKKIESDFNLLKSK
jgi:hypothetical protein